MPFDPENKACKLCTKLTGEEQPLCEAWYSAECLTKDRALLILLSTFTNNQKIKKEK